MRSTPGQDVTAAMQGELATQVLEGCHDELTQYCAEVTRSAKNVSPSA